MGVVGEERYVKQSEFIHVIWEKTPYMQALRWAQARTEGSFSIEMIVSQ